METLVKLSRRHVQARPLTASAGGWSGAVCADEEKRGTEHDMTLSHEHCLLPGLIQLLQLGNRSPQNFSSKSAEIRKNQVLIPLPYTDLLGAHTCPILLPTGPLLVRSGHIAFVPGSWVRVRLPGQRQPKVNKGNKNKIRILSRLLMDRHVPVHSVHSNLVFLLVRKTWWHLLSICTEHSIVLVSQCLLPTT